MAGRGERVRGKWMEGRRCSHHCLLYGFHPSHRLHLALHRLRRRPLCPQGFLVHVHLLELRLLRLESKFRVAARRGRQAGIGWAWRWEREEWVGLSAASVSNGPRWQVACDPASDQRGASGESEARGSKASAARHTPTGPIVSRSSSCALYTAAPLASFPAPKTAWHF